MPLAIPTTLSDDKESENRTIDSYGLFHVTCHSMVRALSRLMKISCLIATQSENVRSPWSIELRCLLNEDLLRPQPKVLLTRA